MRVFRQWAWCVLLIAISGYAAPLRTPEAKLREAVQAGDVLRARLLLNDWADANAADADGNTALMFAVCACETAGLDSSELVHLLLVNGADPNLKNNQGETALLIAAARGRFDLVQMLVRYGAKARKLDQRGDTAITLATQAHHDEIAVFLARLER